MAKYSDVINGLSLFLELHGDKHGVCAEHDILYAGHCEEGQLTDQQRGQLEEWGWHYDSTIDSWARFV